MLWALVPAKGFALAKSRLSGALAASERRGLARAMLEDVLSALSAMPQFAGILLVSDDPAGESLARKYRIEWLPERELGARGLNSAVAAGWRRLAARGAADVMVLHADLPLLRARSIDRLLGSYREPGVDLVIAPDRHGAGSNILLAPARMALPLRYGPGSCQAHCAAAAERGWRVALVADECTGLDIDCPEDLLQACRYLRRRRADSHSARLLLESGIAGRLLAMRRGELGQAAPAPSAAAGS